ncbi:MAG: hypothetical protein ACLUMK_00705 [Christensenellales bacterium]
MDEKELEHMLEKGLSDFDFSLERRQAVLQTIRKKENPVVKRKASAVLVLAVVPPHRRRGTGGYAWYIRACQKVAKTSRASIDCKVGNRF